MNDTPPSLPDIMTVPETAAYLKLSRSKVYDMIKMGKMPHVRIGRNVRVRHKDLMRWLDDQRVECEQPLFS